MEKTTNYKLPRWEKDDFVKMDDFNAAFQTIDETLKAGADAVADEAAARETAVTAVAQALGTGGQNCRIAWGSYTGNGKYGSSNPNTLNFDFKPMMVWVGGANSGGGTAFPATFLRPVTLSRSDSATPDHQLNVNWGENQVSWYASSYTTIYAANQCNAENTTYYYVAIGY